MTARRVNTRISGLVIAVALANPGSARAQFGLEDVPCIPYPIFSEFNLGYGSGTDAGIMPFAYGSFGVTGYDGFGGMNAIPLERLWPGHWPKAADEHFGSAPRRRQHQSPATDQSGASDTTQIIDEPHGPRDGSDA